MMKKRLIVIVFGTVLLIAVAVVVALRERQPVSKPEASVAQTPAEVRVKAVERKAEPMDNGEVAAASGAVAIGCGEDAATAGRYEARNDALRSIARRRDLLEDDVAALMAYLRRADDAMRVERVAALKNDVMNLLRNQEPPVEGLAETLIAMIEGKKHPPVVIDYCIQHLGAMVNELGDATRGGALGDRALPDGGVRGVLVRAAREKTKTYAGTALYSLAEDKRDSGGTGTPSKARLN